MLLDNARRKGAEVREQTPVTHVLRDKKGRTLGVAATGPDGTTREFFAPVTIDCSGREQVAVSREGWRIKDPNQQACDLTYYSGAKRDLHRRETPQWPTRRGAMVLDIPLRGDAVSVGVVADKIPFPTRKTRGDPHPRSNASLDRGSSARREQFGELGDERISPIVLLLRSGCIIAVAMRRPFMMYFQWCIPCVESGEMAADAVDAALPRAYHGARALPNTESSSAALGEYAQACHAFTI